MYLVNRGLTPPFDQRNLRLVPRFYKDSTGKLVKITDGSENAGV